jgi:hypothetical protein
MEPPRIGVNGRQKIATRIASTVVRRLLGRVGFAFGRFFAKISLSETHLGPLLNQVSAFEGMQKVLVAVSAEDNRSMRTRQACCNRYAVGISEMIEVTSTIREGSSLFKPFLAVERHGERMCRKSAASVGISTDTSVAFSQMPRYPQNKVVLLQLHSKLISVHHRWHCDCLPTS